MIMIDVTIIVIHTKKWFYNSINIDKYTKRAGRLIAKDAIKRANRKLIIGFVMIVI